ncbi:MAG: hypothetical protein JXR86_13950 [Spirochaetales bacterium]|nr:hypothetical protein [Spirochaetales bacterium]
MIIRKLLFIIFLLSGLPLRSQQASIYPGPDPFSVDGRSALYCIALLRENPFLEQKDSNGASSVLKINTVWSYFLEFDESWPEGHQLRYDIIVNGSPLDWDNSFIEYGGEMINLRLLFTYRNQYPPSGLSYRSIPSEGEEE